MRSEYDNTGTYFPTCDLAGWIPTQTNLRKYIELENN